MNEIVQEGISERMKQKDIINIRMHDDVFKNIYGDSILECLPALYSQ